MMSLNRADYYFPDYITIERDGQKPQLRVGDRIRFKSTGGAGRLNASKKKQTIIVALFPFVPDNGIYFRFLGFCIESQDLSPYQVAHVQASDHYPLTEDQKHAMAARLKIWVRHHYQQAKHAASAETDSSRCDLYVFAEIFSPNIHNTDNSKLTEELSELKTTLKRMYDSVGHLEKRVSTLEKRDTGDRKALETKWKKLEQRVGSLEDRVEEEAKDMGKKLSHLSARPAEVPPSQPQTVQYVFVPGPPQFSPYPPPGY